MIIKLGNSMEQLGLKGGRHLLDWMALLSLQGVTCLNSAFFCHDSNRIDGCGPKILNLNLRFL